MIKSLHPRFLLLIALGGLSMLSACGTNNGSDNLKHSSGTPVNPNTDPAGQGLPGSASTGANTRGTPGRP